ncbi:MAG: hypothetical protein RL698_269 [Pseudomonadota bacterium]|jgi:site-specific recombinase
MDEKPTFRESVMTFLHQFGEVMGNLVLGALYYVLLGPVALVGRLFADPLRMRRPADSSFLPWQEENDTLPEAHRQG